ncbi:transcription elongation factor GreA [Bradyrhizobium sp. OAE829]|uniref:transcription elongation factor GreA n=1 Tax=Bradyrhizobium sp. OAE829 TaxID=2663807 RepID=UPI00178AA259
MNQDTDRSYEKLPVTSEGYAVLHAELRHRIQIERPRTGERIQDAIADDPNLPENAEYQTAKSEQDFNEARIADLQSKLARAEVIDVSKLSGDTVKFGATVTVIDEDTNEKRLWQIVGEPEADARKGKISVFSPLARALIGKAKDSTVEVLTPSGAKAYKISNVQWR